MKDLPVPLRLILTEILHYRLIFGHPKHPEIQIDLKKRKAGYKGELILSHYVKEFPQEKYYIFHDLQLEHNGIYFQIDTLLISRNYILIIEAKNIVGTLLFDNVFNQLIRKNTDGTEDVFEDPRVQAKRLCKLLGGLLAKNGLNFLPIDHLVFFSSSTKTILKTNTNDYRGLERVCKGRDLFNKIDQLDKAYTQAKVNDESILEISKFLLSQHKPQKINILQEYGLTGTDIRTGVRCTQCFHIPMVYKRGKWLCPICLAISKDAFISGVDDYFLLFKPCITNAECRNFLHIPTVDTTQKILLLLNLPSEGNTRNRVYFPPSEQFYIEKVPHAFQNKRK
jgi:hypothetical protein